MSINNNTTTKKGLSEEELIRIEKLLNRKPNEIELQLFDALWSEHISLKNAYKWLQTLPKESDLKVKANCFNDVGIIEIDNNTLVALKIKSYNHPSAFEPEKGAAAAIAISNRRVFSKGFEPVAFLNSLRLGNVERLKTKETLYKFIDGISNYGNNTGIPMAGTDIKFDSSYNENPLVNILAVGLADKQEKQEKTQTGDLILIIGKKTGKEGHKGVNFASTDISGEHNEELFPRAEANPLYEKHLLEAILEGMSKACFKLAEGLDAGGLLNALVKLGGASGLGVKIDVDKIHASDEKVNPVEILLSETPGRIVVSAPENKFDACKEICDKWEVEYSYIGNITNGNDLNIQKAGEPIASFPVDAGLPGKGAPVYKRDFEVSDFPEEFNSININDIPEPKNLKKVAWQLIAHPNISSINWIAEQFDSTIGGTNLSTNFPSDSTVINIKDNDKALVFHMISNGRYVNSDPAQGAAIAVAQAARKIACSGGKPIAVSVGLNFGNPDDSKVYKQFVETVNGIGQACRRFKIPAIGNNLSFYNQTIKAKETIAIAPTPIIGMVGVLDDINRQMTKGFKHKGDMIFLIGENRNDISSSEYLKYTNKTNDVPAPFLDLEFETELNNIIIELIKANLIRSAHDVAEGGLFISLFEASLPNLLGFDITTDSELREDAFLFGESQGRVLVSVTPHKEAAFIDFMMKHDMPTLMLGHVTKGEMRIDEKSFGFSSEGKEIYENALRKILEKI